MTGAGEKVLAGLEQAVVYERLKKILMLHLGVAESEITPDVLLVPDDSDRPHLGADSLDIVELSMAAEEEFNLSILDEDIDPLNKATFAELVGFVHGKCIEQGQRW